VAFVTAEIFDYLNCQGKRHVYKFDYRFIMSISRCAKSGRKHPVLNNIVSLRPDMFDRDLPAKKAIRSSMKDERAALRVVSRSRLATKKSCADGLDACRAIARLSMAC